MSTFFVQTLFISGNGGDFTLTLGSNIWDYIINFSGICLYADVPRGACSILSRCRNCPAG